MQSATRSESARTNSTISITCGLAGVDFGAVFDPLLESAFLGEEQAIGGTEIMDLLAGEAACALGRRH